MPSINRISPLRCPSNEQFEKSGILPVVSHIFEFRCMAFSNDRIEIGLYVNSDTRAYDVMKSTASYERRVSGSASADTTEMIHAIEGAATLMSESVSTKNDLHAAVRPSHPFSALNRSNDNFGDCSMQLC